MLLLRRCAALAAAYAVALQLVLSAFAMVAPLVLAADAGFATCRRDNSNSHTGPGTQDACGACLAGHCASAAASPDRDAVAALWPATRTHAEVSPSARALSPATPRVAAHSPRAPPFG